MLSMSDENKNINEEGQNVDNQEEKSIVEKAVDKVKEVIEDVKEALNPQSKIEINNALFEPSIPSKRDIRAFQFERIGYFCVDSKDSTEDQLVVNQTVALRDSWGRGK